jgi:hypothetical protein
VREHKTFRSGANSQLRGSVGLPDDWQTFTAHYDEIADAVVLRVKTRFEEPVRESPTVELVAPCPACTDGARRARVCVPALRCPQAEGQAMKRRAPLLASMAMHIIQQLGGRLWSKQRDILNAVFGSSRKRICVVKSCTGAGKSHVAAYIAWAWLLSGHGRLVVTTAPSQRQVNGAVWNEMRIIARRMEKAGVSIGGSLAPKAANYEGPHGRRAIGYSTDSATNFAGWHSPGGTLVIIDDAQGLDEEAWSTILGTVTGENDRILAIANPLSPSGTFYALCTTVGGDAVERITISAFDTPNLEDGPRDHRRHGHEGAGRIDPRCRRRRVAIVEGARASASSPTPTTWRSCRCRGSRRRMTDGRSGRRRSSTRLPSRCRWPPTLRALASTAASPLSFATTCFATASAHRNEFACSRRSSATRSSPSRTRWARRGCSNGSGATSGLTPSASTRWRSGKASTTASSRSGVPVIGMSGGTVANDPTRYVNQRAEVLHAFRDALRPRSTDGRPTRARW